MKVILKFLVAILKKSKKDMSKINVRNVFYLIAYTILSF